MHIIETAFNVSLVEHPTGGAPGFFPLRKYGVKLPSGLIHWFESVDDAKRSNYWPVSP